MQGINNNGSPVPWRQSASYLYSVSETAILIREKLPKQPHPNRYVLSWFQKDIATGKAERAFCFMPEVVRVVGG